MNIEHATVALIESCITEFERVKGFKPEKIEVSRNDFYFLSKEIGRGLSHETSVEIADVLVEPAEYVMDGNFSLIY